MPVAQAWEDMGATAMMVSLSYVPSDRFVSPQHGLQGPVGQFEEQATAQSFEPTTLSQGQWCGLYDTIP